MPNHSESPNPPAPRGRPPKPEADQLVKVVSYIPKRFLPSLDAMAADDGRSRASMIDRILQAAIKKWQREQVVADLVQTFQEMKNSVGDMASAPAPATSRDDESQIQEVLKSEEKKS
jgi:hypothetical protein